MSEKTELHYVIEVKIPESGPRKFVIHHQFSIGLDPRNDLVIIGPKIKSKHFLLKSQSGLLTLMYSGADGESFLNQIPIENGKLYILEIGDQLIVDKTTIIIKTEVGPKKNAPQNLPPIPDTTSPDLRVLSAIEATAEEENIIDRNLQVEDQQLKDLEILNSKTNSNHLNSFLELNVLAIKLIPYKVYGFLFDIAFTIFILTFIIPKLGLLSTYQDFFFPISSLLIKGLLIVDQWKIFHSTKLLSFLEFFIHFHFIMISLSLLFGTTPGRFMVGLYQSQQQNFIVKHFKAYIYSLVNLFCLYFLIFDIPLYRGQTFKELITFTKHDLRLTAIARLSRRALMPLFIIISLFIFSFLPLPYNSVLSFVTQRKSHLRDLHSYPLITSSKELGLEFNSEIKNQYLILPLYENQKISLTFFDSVSKKTITLKEESRLFYNELLFRLRYANPIASLTIPDELIEARHMKNLFMKALGINPMTLPMDILNKQIFVAGQFLIRNQILKSFSEISLSLNAFDSHNAVILVKADNNKTNIQRLFLFCKNQMIEFSLKSSNNIMLNDDFEQSVLAKLSIADGHTFSSTTPQILEVIDAFILDQPQTLLTYYINEVNNKMNKNRALQDPEALQFLKKNILQNKRAIEKNNNFTRSIEKSFNDLINSL